MAVGFRKAPTATFVAEAGDPALEKMAGGAATDLIAKKEEDESSPSGHSRR